jgi:type I restriction enzyme, S subunit
MSGMNFLERLLDGAVVEWTALGVVCDVHTGGEAPANCIKGSIPSSIFKYPVYGNGAEIYGYTDSYKIGKDAVTISSIGANTGTVYFRKACFTPIIRLKVLMPKYDELLPRYIYHYLSSQTISSKKSSVPNVSKERFKKIQIPIPCPDNPDRSLAIQAEIVRILDTFTELTAELTAELGDRQKQYNYYRDRLLTFEEGEVEWKTLGEVALDFGRGKSKHRPRNDPKLYGGNTPFIQTGDIRNASHVIEAYSQTYSEIGLKQSKLWPKDTLCITIAANIAETSILGFDACFPDSVIGFVANPEKTTSGYVEYLLSSLKTKLEEMGQGSAQSNINLGTFENLKFPFPPLAEQVRIASLLDKFDALTTSISEGLPREIALRQQQYEYYRDLLLTFPKPEAVEV